MFIMSILDWPITERPREKLLSSGPQALSDAELLAIFLRVGCAGKTAVSMARELLSEFGGLRPLLAAKQQEFCRGKGLGSAKYAQLQAVLEMARRHLAAELKAGVLLSSPSVLRQYLQAQLRHQTREVFAVLFLDTQNRMIAYDEIFFGTLDAASVYPREIVKKTLTHNAASVIFAHNHPSGVAEPSQADRRITERLQAALALIDVKVLDHMIVGEGDLVSFAERGYL
jgi:DNA repair protein RadC